MHSARRWVLLVIVLLVAAGAWWLRQRSAPATVSAYFVRAEGSVSTLQPVERAAAGHSLEALAAGALRALLAGPTEAERAAGLSTAIPAGTRLRGVQVKDGVIVVDLDRTVESGGGSSSMLARVWQIVYTATQFSNAPRVRLLIDGQERQALGGEGVIIDHPLGRPATMPRF